MKRTLLLSASIALWFVFAGQALAETTQELLDALPAKIQADAEAKRNEKPATAHGVPDPSFFMGLLRNAKDLLGRGEEAAAVGQLESIAGNAVTGTLRDACESVVRSIERDRTEREAGIAAESAAVLHRASDAVVQAKTPKDLDPTLQELARLSEKPELTRSGGRNSEGIGRRVQAVSRFISRWQDYLLALGRNDNRQAADLLRSLVSENNDAIQALGLPRSQIISRLPPANQADGGTAPQRSQAEISASIEAVLDRIKTLDDLPAANRDLLAVRRELNTRSGGYGTTYNELNGALSGVQSLQRAYAELQNGLTRSPETWIASLGASQSTEGNQGRFLPLRVQLIKLLLPHTLGAPAEKPAPEERVDTFLDRLIDLAKKRGDWHAVARGLQCRRVVSDQDGDNGMANRGREEAFQEFFAGQNFEQAAQYEQAVVAYVSALSSGLEDIPSTVIGERLAAIKRDHPLEYASGSRAALPPGWEQYRNSHGPFGAPAAIASAPEPPSSPTPAPAAAPASTPASAPAAKPAVSPQPVVSPSPTPASGAASAPPSP